MELSRSCLETLSLFQQRFFATPDEIQSFIQEVPLRILTDMEGLSNGDSDEGRMKQALGVFLLSAAKNNYSEAEIVEYMKHLGWSDDLITAVASVYEPSRQCLRDSIEEPCSSLPRLVKLECSLLELNTEEDPSLIDFSHRLAYYSVTLHYRNSDGSDSVVNKIVSSIQLNSILVSLRSALSQCDSLLSSLHQAEEGSVL